MIRDPSDGTIRNPPGASPSSPSEQSAGELRAPLLDIGTSGLPIGSGKPKDILRLEASRHWLKDYHASRNPEKVVRELGEGSET